MTLKEVKQLHPGDEVYFTDPAELEGEEEHSSRHIVIQEINIVGEIVCIVERDGGNLECFPHELS